MNTNDVDNSPANEPTANETDQQFKIELETLRADLARQQELVVRTLADLDNIRKRTIREREEWRTLAIAGLIEALLPVLDAFQMGLSAAENKPEAADLVVGFKMAYELMLRVLGEQGLSVINPIGQPLDPHLHECVAHQPSADVAEDTVINVIRVGYKLGERLVRPAGVIVASTPV